MRMGRRWCCGCGEYLEGDLEELFYTCNRKGGDGLSTACRLCVRLYNQRYYRRHKQETYERVALWRKENPEKLRVQRIRNAKSARVRRRLRKEATSLVDD